MSFFRYGTSETDYLQARDPRLGEAISRIGQIERATNPDLFTAVVHSIVGQQISTKAHATVWQRMEDGLGRIDAQSLLAAGEDKLQAFGMTFRKASYIHDFASRIIEGKFDLDAVRELPDAEAIRALADLRGIGVWTAEMILLFCLQRPDILSYDDLGIRRGLRMLHGLTKISRKDFGHWRELYSPCGSVASLYLWAIAGGALPELADPAQTASPQPDPDTRNKTAGGRKRKA